MPRLPLAIRVAAGLAATAVHEVRGLPAAVISLPVTAVSQVLQTYMRAQQQVTALAIRGDEVLSFLSPAQDSPEWATFDAERPGASGPVGLAAGTTSARPSSAGRFALYSQVPQDVPTRRRTAATRPARPTPNTAAEQTATAAAIPPAPLPGYDAMTLAQLRARLRTLSLVELEDLLLHERAGQARAPFLTMLSNRVASVRSQ